MTAYSESHPGGSVRAERSQPLVGLFGQLLVLSLLEIAAGLTASGWVIGIACGVTLCSLLANELAHGDKHGLGPADRITLLRALLVGGVTALVVTSLSQPIVVPLLVSVTVVALSLDAVDGYVARRTRTVSPFGARFDMEVDAFLILVLSVYVAGSFGVWVLAFGAARYMYVVATWMLPWLRAPLPYRYWRKVVAATVGVVLTIAASNFLQPITTVACLVIALMLLAESFGRDVWWLWSRRTEIPRVDQPDQPTQATWAEAGVDVAPV